MPKIPYSKRPDGRYYKQIVIGFDSKGKRKVKTLYDRDWRKLDKKVKEFYLNAEHGVFINEDITLGECAELWLKTKNNIRVSTLKIYKGAIKYLKPIEHILLKNVKLLHIQSIYNDMYNNNVQESIHTLNRLLKNIYDYAINNNFVTVNLAKKTILPKRNCKKRRGLTDKEKQAVFDNFDKFSGFEQGLLMLLYYTGMRRNEILALQKKDIDLKKKIIHVCKTLVSGKNYKTVVQNQTKTPAEMRIIPITTQLEDFLRDYLKPLKDEDFLFLSNKGNLIQSSVFAYRWKKILSKINKYLPPNEPTNITPHYFRHNFTTDLIYAGVPLKTVQTIMGHENIQTTMDIYTDVRYDNDEVIEKLDNYLK